MDFNTSLAKKVQSLQKIGPKYKNLFNFSDFSSVQPLANPHKIRYIQKVHLIGALYEPRENIKSGISY